MKLFIDGTELSNIPVTQNEVGDIYTSVDGNTLYSTLLKDFDAGIGLPADSVKYVHAGSHFSTNYNGVNILAQRALDFAKVGVITCDEDIDVIAGRADLGAQSFTRIKTSVGIIDLVHQIPLTGITKVKAGSPICKQAWNHLHIYLQGGKIRDIILGVDTMINVGDKVEFTDVTNHYGNPVTGEIDGKIATGAVGKIIAGPKPYSPSGKIYPYYDVSFSDPATGWAYDGNMKVTTKEVTKRDGTTPKPPEPPVTNFVTKEDFDTYKTETNKRIEILEKKTKAIVDGLGSTATAANAIK